MSMLAATGGISGALPPTSARVVLWSEHTEPQDIYPHGINGALAQYLADQQWPQVTLAGFRSEREEFDAASLKDTGVLVWFGHTRHEDVPDALAEAIAHEVREHGMGFVALHSAHFSKPFRQLLGTSAAWHHYDEVAGAECVQIAMPEHPIAQGVGDFVIPQTELYGEPFDVPPPDAVICTGRWPHGEESREVMAWTLGKGRVVYIRAGHETYPIYHQEPMQRLVANSVRWANLRSMQ